jgi:hypothetical protein
VSVWGNFNGATTPPAGTPDLAIRWSPEDSQHRVYADGQEVFNGGHSYYDCHRWCQNKYRLTSTMMLPIYSAYETHIREVDPCDEEDEEPEPSPPPAQCAPAAPVAPEPSGPPDPVAPAVTNRFRKPDAQRK